MTVPSALLLDPRLFFPTLENENMRIEDWEFRLQICRLQISYFQIFNFQFESMYRGQKCLDILIVQVFRNTQWKVDNIPTRAFKVGSSNSPLSSLFIFFMVKWEYVLPWPLKLYWHQCEVGEAGGAEQKGSFSFTVYIIGYDSYCRVEIETLCQTACRL